MTLLCTFCIGPLMISIGTHTIFVGRISLLDKVYLQGAKARIAGLFLILPLLGLFALLSFDPMLYSSLWVFPSLVHMLLPVFAKSIEIQILMDALYWLYFKAGMLVPVGLVGASVWTGIWVTVSARKNRLSQDSSTGHPPNDTSLLERGR